MNRTMHRLVFFALLVTLVSLAYGINYAYLSDHELLDFGDRIRFGHGDTLTGPVHSNSQIAIMEDPVFYDIVTQASSANDFEHGPGYNPQFLGPDPIFHTALIVIPNHADFLHEHATRTFDPGPFEQMKLDIDSNLAVLYTWPLGIGFNQAVTENDTILLDSTEILFFDCPLRVSTRVAGDITILTTRDLGLDDNVTTVDADIVTGRTPEDSPNFLTLVSEGEIVVRNTPENGRENCNGLGPPFQLNPDLKDIVVTANLFALGGSFTFDQQNDIDSNYSCECAPDERGRVSLYGGITQQRHGYLHRSNHGGTGYAKTIRYDERLRWRPNPVLGPFAPMLPDTFDFGNVAVGQTLWDTLEIHNSPPGYLGAVLATMPFEALRVEPFFGPTFHIPMHFTPPHTGAFSGVLTVSTSYRFMQIILLGHGIPGGTPPLAPPRAYPNPFNNSTAISFELETAGRVTVEIFDVLGRRAMTLMNDELPAGSHSVMMDARALASGIYFAQLRTPTQLKTLKLLLVK